ncbi:MAG: ATP-binding cassette domain-containing protein [Propionibacteriaceae bacterium]|nr:ATP-binding cassette domain-containing protein [Propionibacteriaceae bacterium]
MTSAASVHADHLSHRFPGTDWLFEDVTFRLTPGEITCVTGPSGCGKSTLLSLLAGWQEPTTGEVRRDGIHRVGWVFQNPHGVPHRTAVDHVAFPFLQRGLNRRHADGQARVVLDRFGLGAVGDREFSALSGGEAQRLMLARAVAAAPDLLLVDEPTAQLDRVMAASVQTTLASLAQADTIVVIATHDPDVRAQATQVIDLARAHTDPGRSATAQPRLVPGGDMPAEPPTRRVREDGR